MGENMSDLSTIGRTYGNNAIATIRKIQNQHHKLANQKNRRIFLLRCKTDNLTPKFLDINVKHIDFSSNQLKLKFNQHINQFKVSTVNLLLSDTITKIKYIEHAIETEFQKLKTIILNSDTFNAILTSQRHIYEQLFNKIKARNIKKIDQLKHKNNNNFGIQMPPSEWIENMSDIQLPQYVTDTLSLGPNFSMPFVEQRDIPTPNIIASIETGIKNLTTENKDKIRAHCCNLLTNHNVKNSYTKNKNYQKVYNNLQINLIKTKQFLKNHPSLKILRPDKANKTVVMTTDTYNKKMLELINDKATYKKLNNDPTNIFQKMNNNLIKKWENQNYISPNIAKKLIINNAISPKIYGLPKIHKREIPMRPIVSCVQSPFAGLSKFLKKILDNVANKNTSYIRDSWDFKNKINNLIIPADYIIVSLDVVSLYTNIPIDLAIEIICKKWHEIKNYTDIPLEEFKEGVTLTLNNTYFDFDGTHYKQIKGCAMGSSISSVIAQLVLEDLENSILPKLNFQLPFFYRYVDDCLTAIPKGQENYILEKFHNYHDHLKFTIEIENNHSINFLDMTIYHDNNNMETEWHTKPTWSGRYLNFLSQHPMSQKKSVIIGLADRAINLSDNTHRHSAIQKAKHTLKLNNYPDKLVNKIFNSRLQKFNNKINTTNLIKKDKPTYLTLPYVTSLSENFEKYFKKHNITVCHKPVNLLQQNYSKLKTKTPKLKKTHTIYQIPCNDCNGVYIGQTSQYLANRLNGHKFDKKNTTALSKHQTENNHKFNFPDTKILGTEQNKQKREILEMIHIKKNPQSINNRADVKNLSIIYNNIF